VNAHRDAFSKAMNDPDLLLEASRRNIELFNPSRGEAINKRIEELYTILPEIVEKASKVTGVGADAK
jgi:hypothetical protein